MTWGARQKLLVVAIIIVAMAIIIAIIMPLINVENSGQEVLIGVSVPLSGPVAALGAKAVNGMQIAVDEVNNSGGVNSKRLKLAIEDDKCNADEGTRTVNKLLNMSNAKALVIYCGAVTGAIAPLIEGKAITLSLSIRPEPLEGKYSGLFNLAPAPQKEAEIMANHIYSKGIKKVAILYQSDFFGQTYKDKFAKAFTKLGGVITMTGTLDNLAQPDFKTDLIKARNLNSEAIFSSFNAPQYAVILKQAKELGYSPKFFSTWNIESPQLISTAGNLADGIEYTYTFAPGMNTVYEKFSQTFLNQFGENPELNAANGHDSILILAQALNICGGDINCMITNVQSIKDYQGASGKITFQNQMADKEIFIKTIKAGKFVPVLEK